MKITLKLFATLSDYLPPERKDNALVLEVAERTTIDHLIDRFNLPRNLVHLVLVNGVYVAPEDRVTRTFADGDVLAIWPPVAGG